MNTNDIARIAALVGEPARTAMLVALMDGRALTANELARAAGVQPPTASRHLAQLVDAGLLALQARGRHCFHRLASPEVARVLEGIMQLAADRPAAAQPVPIGPRDASMRWARTCYDHLAGRLGVAIADRLLEDGAIAFDGDSGCVREAAAAALDRMGLDSAAASADPGRRAHCLPCLDWSERRPHLAGRLGALICVHCLARGWLLRRTGSRSLCLTPRGALGLQGWLGAARWGALAAAAPSPA